MDPVDIRKRLRYIPETGEILWVLGQRRGKAAGGLDREGYVRISVCGRTYYGHRLAWLLYYGTWPAQYIDHINGERWDNRIANLRDVSKSANLRNQSSRKSASGVMGVYKTPNGRWEVKIYDGRKNISLGRFDTIDEAVKVRKDAEVRLGYHDNHGRRAA